MAWFKRFSFLHYSFFITVSPSLVLSFSFTFLWNFSFDSPLISLSLFSILTIVFYYVFSVFLFHCNVGFWKFSLLDIVTTFIVYHFSNPNIVYITFLTFVPTIFGHITLLTNFNFMFILHACISISHDYENRVCHCFDLVKVLTCIDLHFYSLNASLFHYLYCDYSHSVMIVFIISCHCFDLYALLLPLLIQSNVSFWPYSIVFHYTTLIFIVL